MSHKPFIRTLRAQWLGQQLREIREQRGLSLEMVAAHLNRDRSALGRYERAEWPFPRPDVHTLLDFYGFYHASERARLLNLAEEVWRRDRWDDDYGDLIDSAFIDYPWLESRAERISSYNALLLPGLLQTRDYAEAVIRNAEEPDVSKEKVARWVELRMERQRVLDLPGHTYIKAIVEEGALRRPVGGRAVMHEQLRHLAKLLQRPKIEIQVLPIGTGLHAGLDGTFTLFAMPKPYPAVAYIENLGGRLYLEFPKSDKFVHVYDRLRRAALAPVESAKLITTIAEELS